MSLLVEADLTGPYPDGLRAKGPGPWAGPASYGPVMDIEGFYSADERRRASEEIEYGRGWRDEHGVRYELSYVVDTGELYVMREPMTGPVPVSPFGELFASSVPARVLTVAVLAEVGRAELDAALEGWPQVMERPDSVRWLIDRLHGAGIFVDPNAPA